MIPPVPSIENYGVTEQYGFLPSELPLDRLPNAYYTPWESAASSLQALILSRRLRSVMRRMPILSTAWLRTDGEWRRAYMILAFLSNAYIWGGDHPAEVCSCSLLLALGHG